MSSATSDARARRVLVVEDDERILSALQLLLEPFFEVQEAIDGASAEYWLDKQQFDVAYVDYTLPDMTGIDLLQRIRAQNPLVRRVITSGRLLPELFQVPLHGLIHCFVLKPARFDEILWACGGWATGRSSLTL